MIDALYMLDKATSVVDMLNGVCKDVGIKQHEQPPTMFLFRKHKGSQGFEFKVPSHKMYADFWSLPQTEWASTAKFLFQTELNDGAEGYVVSFCARSPQAKGRPDSLILAVYSNSLRRGDCFFVDLNNPSKNIDVFDPRNMSKLLPALISP